MAEISNFRQPDAAPTHFIEFLDYLDNLAETKNFRAETTKRMNLASGHRVLDLGCGIGGATFLIAESTGPSGLAAGVDISSALIAVANQRASNRPGLEFRVGTACAVPYPNAFFDVARSERVFLYLSNRLAAICEMKRVVKRGGLLCLIDTDFESTAIYSTKPLLTRKMTSIVAATLPNPNSGRDLPALARQAGLNDIKTEIFAIATPYEFVGLAIVGALSKAVENGIVSRSEVDEWLDELALLHERGDFLQMWFVVHVSGVV